VLPADGIYDHTKDPNGWIIDLAGASLAERPDIYRALSPLSHVRTGLPPFLVVHGHDDVVEVEGASALVDALRATANDVLFLHLDGAGHINSPSTASQGVYLHARAGGCDARLPPTDAGGTVMRAANVGLLGAVLATEIGHETVAHAEPENAVSLELTSLQPTTLTVELDRDLGRRKLSIAAAVGVRSAALGDYTSWTGGAGIELRRWRRQAMRGWYGGVGLDVAATRVTQEMDDRALGTTWTTSGTVSLGYRFILIRAIALTPSFAVGGVVERGPMSPATIRGVGVVGVTAGVTF